MSEPMSTPRITAQYLDNYVGQNVMIVGKIVQLRGDSAIMDSAGNITLALDRVRSPPSPRFPTPSRIPFPVEQR